MADKTPRLCVGCGGPLAVAEKADRICTLCKFGQQMRSWLATLDILW